MVKDYVAPGPSRSEVDSWQGLLVLEFGTAWCGHCQAAAPAVAKALTDFPAVQHLKVEDGPGRRLGRSFGVKLWPTLIFLKDGHEVGRAVRPQTPEEIRTHLDRLS